MSGVGPRVSSSSSVVRVLLVVPGVAGWFGGGGAGEGDGVFGGDVVEEVEVGEGLQGAEGVAGEGAGGLVPVGAGEDVGVAGQGGGGGQVAAGEADRAGFLAEDGDAGAPALGGGAAPLGGVGGDGEGGAPGEPLDLEPGPALQLAQDEGLGAGRLVLVQGLERRRDQFGLGLGEGAVGEQAADAGQPQPEGPGQAGEVLRRYRAHRQRAGELVDEAVVPPVGQVIAAAGQRPARPSSRVMARSAPRVPAAAQDSIVAHRAAIPTSAPASAPS